MIKKIFGYVTSFWNILDLAGLVLFLIGLTMRIVVFHVSDIDANLQLDLIEWAHTLYVFSLIIYYVRVTHTCSVSQQLGPKIIMIAKMVRHFQLNPIVLICLSV